MRNLRTDHVLAGPQPNYAVIRVPQDVRVPPFVRAKDGWWYDLDCMPVRFEFGRTDWVAVPTGKFEVREHDGAVAEVFEVRL
jgi:hypothetical protein